MQITKTVLIATDVELKVATNHFFKFHAVLMRCTLRTCFTQIKLFSVNVIKWSPNI